MAHCHPAGCGRCHSAKPYVAAVSLRAWNAKGMKSAWGASIPFCVRPEKSALFASKRWASGIRQKQSRRASCIHKFNRRYRGKSRRAIQHGRLHGETKPRRKLTGLRALYYRYLYELGALPRKPRRPKLCRAAGCLQVRPAHPADGVFI